MKKLNDYKLTDEITVGQLLMWMSEKSHESKTNIVELISHRFENRYLKHIKPSDSGFLIMAVSCLVIEALQSFREGKPDTNGISRKMFQNFFKDHKANFPGFYDISNEFYYHVRCGILHQSETTNAWRIVRKGKLLDDLEFSINARLFIQALDKSVNEYLDELSNSDFSSERWGKALSKLKSICDNCDRTPIS